MGSEIIKKDMREFEKTVKELSDSIKSASSLWKDSKYSELSSSISQVARNSRDVMLAGEHCCNEIDRFFEIAAEEY